MDAITRIKLQKQPKKDYLQETLDNVHMQMNPNSADVQIPYKDGLSTSDAKIPYKDGLRTSTDPQPEKPQAEEQISTPTPKVAERGLNQSDLQAVNNPSEEQIQVNNQIAAVKPKEGVPADYVIPSPVEFGAKYDNAQMQKDLADPTKGYYYVAQQLNRDSAYEGQDEIDKREKREKQRNLITSIADGLSSIANLGGTLAGGMNQQQTSLSEANMKRREYQRSLREKDRDKWQAMMLRTGEQQMNYGLARSKQEIERVQNALQFQYQQNRLELDRVREQRMFAKDQASIDYYDKREALLKAQEQKFLSDIENNKAKTGAMIEKYKSDASANQTRAGASATNANTGITKAKEQERHNKADEDIERNKTTSTGSGKYNPTPTTVEPPKQPVKQSTPTKNTSSLGKYGFNYGNNKKRTTPGTPR